MQGNRGASRGSWLVPCGPWRRDAGIQQGVKRHRFRPKAGPCRSVSRIGRVGRGPALHAPRPGGSAREPDVLALCRCPASYSHLSESCSLAKIFETTEHKSRTLAELRLAQRRQDRKGRMCHSGLSLAFFASWRENRFWLRPEAALGRFVLFVVSGYGEVVLPSAEERNRCLRPWRPAVRRTP